VDFLRISMDEPITVRVPVVLKGTAPAVTVQGGVLLHMLDTLAVECVPGDMPESLELDISNLKELDDALYARDVPLPARVKLMEDADEPIVKAVAPRVVPAEEAAAATEEVAAPAPEAETAEETAE